MPNSANCFVCKLPIDDEKTTCNQCSSGFHKRCLVINDNLDVWICPSCKTGVLEVPKAPRSIRSRSHISHHSRKSGESRISSSSKAEILLKALDEEKELLDKQHKEQELLLQKKHQEEQDFIQKKQQLIQDTIIECSSKSSSKSGSKKSVNITKRSFLTANDRVDAWVATNAEQSTQITSNEQNILSSTFIRPQVTAPLSTLEQAVDLSSNQQILQPQIEVLQPQIVSQPQIEPPPQNEPQPQILSLRYKAFQPQSGTGIENVHQSQETAQRQPVLQHDFALGVQEQMHAANSKPEYLSKTSLRQDGIKLTSLTSSQIAARQITRDLPRFDGEPREWPKFLSSFQRSTALCGFNNSENLERMSRCLKGSALAAVEASLTLDDNLPRVLETLEMLFGKPEYIINSLVEEMRKSKRPSIDSIDTIICYSLEIENISTTMRLARLSEHLWNPVLLNEMVDRLPTPLRLEWAQSSYTKGATSIEVFSLWLKQKAMMYSSILKKPPMLAKAGHSKNQDKSRGFVNVHDNTDTDGKSCCACELSCKSLENCEQFKNLSYNDKWNLVKKNGWCRTCLRRHHGRCRQSQPCGINECAYFHHEMLHKPHAAVEASVNAHILNHASTQCIFKVVPVVIKNGKRTVHTFAMLDDGSSLTLISQEIADQLEATGPHQELCLRWTSNVKRVEYNSQLLNLEISGLGLKGHPYNLRCRTVEKLSLPRQTLNYDSVCEKFEYLRGLPVQSYQNAEIGVLIGMNNANLLLTRDYRTGGIDDLIAAHTKLGCIVFGGGTKNDGSVFHVHECDCLTPEKKIEDLMKENYSIEALGVSKASSVVPSDDHRAYSIWSNTIKYSNSRYEVGLLFKYDKFTLPDSLNMAKRRMYCLQKRCDREPGLRDLIDAQIEDYIKKGYARVVPDHELRTLTSNVWYLPIFIVRNPNKPLKVRLVWDAAATVGETCLNSVLIKGPDLLSTLFGVLLRFRQFRVAISGDIQEMFHQVHVRQEDQRYQMFLWTDSQGRTVTYSMIGMTFGACCSPASAQYIKNYNANKFVNEFPRAVESIRRNHYVDDLLDSVETEDEAIELAREVFNIHKAASFHIRNWISNSVCVAQTLNSCQDGKNLQMFSDAPMEKILGMWWKTTADHFTYSLKYQKTSETVWKGEKTPTKREVLRAVMSIYDPLGLLSHILIFPRILLQNVWREATEWDHEISSELAADWRQWTSLLPKIEEIQIPRWLGYSNTVTDPELHVFTDASIEAYAAVAYLRFKKPDSDEFHVAIVSGKARVAPLKYMSVPRLELMGAVIGNRLAQAIKENLTIGVSKQFFWTDSTCVLGWINSNHRKYRPYVAARIGEILESSTASEWRYVPTAMNVADQATRMKTVDMSSESLWFIGPQFLQKNEDHWPTRFKKEKPESEEMLSQYVVDVNIHHAEIAVENISSWIKLRRVQTYVFRFIQNLKLKRKGEPLLTSKIMSSEELKNSENTLFRQAQEEGFPEEVAILGQSSSGSIPKSSSIFKDSPYLDEFGVMRAHGRVDSITGVPFTTKRPVILPKNHRITSIIMQHFHKMYHHKNSETVINEMRQRFVIPTMRVKLKSIKNDCQWCKNQSAVPGTVMMSGLPEARLKTFSQAFTCIGIDYFGPMFVAVRRSREKRWGILITCLTTRAVHLEVAHSLSADSCILGLRRFMCRRGVPRLIFSDNATNFKCSSRILQEAIKQVDENAMALHFTSPETEWSFIPPASPHMGGAWERMVRSVKTTINSIFPLKFTPNDELLLSVLLEAENIINSRPLTYVPLENDLDEALTPNHFILGTSNGLKSLGNCSEGGFDLRNSWSQSQSYADKLWRKWIQTILPDLRRRDKWLRN